jgi:hypothetical protein
MNTPKRRRRRKKELATKKVICFFPFIGDVSPKKEKNIHINNIRTFNIKI